MNFNQNPTQPSNSIPADKKELIALLKLVKKYNLKGTEELLKQEAGIGEDLDGIEHEVVDVASSVDTQIETDFEIYDICFTDLRNFVEESLDIYKHELSLILYPVFAHIYLKFVQEGNDANRKKFMDKFGTALDVFYSGDIKDLAQIATIQDIGSSDLCQAILQEKYVIRLSRDSQSLIKRHLQDYGTKCDLIQRIVSKHITFDSYEGTARTKAQCEATSGSIIGEARRADNKIRVYYGLLKEIDFQSLTQPPPPEDEDDGGNDPDAPDKPKKKKPKRDPLLSKKSKSDPNAPPIDRIPLPELKDADKLDKLKALRETAKRVHLNKDTLPSVCFYTVLNSHGAVICTDVSDDASMLAAGFTDSHVKVWSLTPAKLREMKSAENLKDIDKDAEDVLVRMMDDRTAETARTFYGHSGPVFRVAFSPEKNLLLSCSEDTTIRLWSLQTWTCIVVYRGHLFPVWDVRFSPHGYYFVSASHDKTARLWATDMNQPLRIFSGHLSDVDTCQFHPNSNYIATGSSDRTVRLWDCLNGQMGKWV
ncbi:TAF5.2 family protein [Megaselia abdita]